QPSRLGGLGLRLGLCGARPGLGLRRDRFTLLDVPGLLLHLTAQPLALDAATLVLCVAGQQDDKCDDDEYRHHRDDDHDYGVAVHDDSFGRSGLVRVTSPAARPNALRRPPLNRAAGQLAEGWIPWSAPPAGVERFLAHRPFRELF